MLKPSFQILVFVGLTLLFLSCEKEKQGIIDSSYSPPVMEAAQLNISYINIDTTSEPTVTKLSNGLFRVTITVYAQASDPDGLVDVKQVGYRVYLPESQALYSSGTLTLDPNQIYSGTATVTLARTDIGIYSIEVFAVDRANLTSNAVQIPLIISKINRTPQIFNLNAPDTLIVPRTGYRLILLAVSVNDSDGIKDLKEVYFTADSASDPKAHQRMFDDGSLAYTGDSVKGDGRFSKIIPLNPDALTTNLRTRREFRFYARDKSGALSDPISHFIIFKAE